MTAVFLALLAAIGGGIGGYFWAAPRRRALDSFARRTGAVVQQENGASLELARRITELGRVPDVIVYPTGGGVGLIGIHKALLELRELGRLDGPLPRQVAAQAAGCAPIVRACERGARTAEPFPDAQTVAFGINVANPLGATLILDAIADTGGCAIAVTDDELLGAVAQTARLEGAFVCPEGGAGVAAIRRLRADGWIAPGDEVVLLNTGAGIKYPQTVPADPPLLRPGERLPAA